MKNKVRAVIDEVRENKMSFGLDMLLCVPAAIIAPVVGAVSGLIDPYYLPDKSKEIRKGNLDTLSEFFYHTFSSMAYVGSLFYFGSKIVENPRNLANYIPLGLNIASGV